MLPAEIVSTPYSVQSWSARMTAGSELTPQSDPKA